MRGFFSETLRLERHRAHRCRPGFQCHATAARWTCGRHNPASEAELAVSEWFLLQRSQSMQQDHTKLMTTVKPMRQHVREHVPQTGAAPMNTRSCARKLFMPSPVWQCQCCAGKPCRQEPKLAVLAVRSVAFLCTSNAVAATSTASNIPPKGDNHRCRAAFVHAVRSVGRMRSGGIRHRVQLLACEVADGLLLGHKTCAAETSSPTLHGYY